LGVFDVADAGPQSLGRFVGLVGGAAMSYDLVHLTAAAPRLLMAIAILLVRAVR
jgi:hypothetical protein